MNVLLYVICIFFVLSVVTAVSVALSKKNEIKCTPKNKSMAALFDVSMGIALLTLGMLMHHLLMPGCKS